MLSLNRVFRRLAGKYTHFTPFPQPYLLFKELVAPDPETGEVCLALPYPARWWFAFFLTFLRGDDVIAVHPRQRHLHLPNHPDANQEPPDNGVDGGKCILQDATNFHVVLDEFGIGKAGVVGLGRHLAGFMLSILVEIWFNFILWTAN